MKANYEIDTAHSTAQFVVRHMMITNVRGGFGGVKGTVVWDRENPEQSSIDAVIDVATITTRDEQRDAHLRSADFFHAEQYPHITFKSRRIARKSDDELSVTGDLTIRGVTREVTLKVEGPTPENKDPWGNIRIGASGATRIRRSDFGLTWNAALETGGLLVGDEIKIELELSLVKAQTATA